MKFTKKEGVEISSNQQWVVDAPDGGFALAKTFGWKTSRSGATLWPEWIQDGARAIKPLALLTEQDVDADNAAMAAFSGGGHSRVVLYTASTEAVRAALDQWRKWRRFESTAECLEASEDAPPKRSRLAWKPEPELLVRTGAEWIARAISFNESRCIEGRRLTDHEVSRHAQNITFDTESNYWTATMKLWPFMATALDKGSGPVVWTVYEAQPSCVDTTCDFVEAEEE